MAKIYDYKANIKVVTTVSGDKVLITNREIFTVIENLIYDAIVKAKRDGRDAAARDYTTLWSELTEKDDLSEN